MARTGPRRERALTAVASLLACTPDLPATRWMGEFLHFATDSSPPSSGPRSSPRSRSSSSAPTTSTTRVRLERAMFESIERIAQQLRPVHGREAAYFVGTVIELSGSPNPHGHLEGDVVLQVQVDDQLLKVRVNLDPDPYRRAGEAHFQQRFVGVRGVLHRGRRVHHLGETRDFAVLSD